MDWERWRPAYESICRDFGYDPAADAAAARDLAALLPRPPPAWRLLGVQLRNRVNVAILGAGPSLEKTPLAALDRRVLVAADGATTWLRESGLVPNVVVTDLDGDAGDLAWAAQQGAYLVVHAHGDNRDALAGLVPLLGPQVWGTYQCAPEPGLETLRNTGGFTDGDRAVLLCESLGTRAVTLWGFDLDAPPSRYSGRFDPATKPRKLAWARRILQECSARGAMRVSGLR